MKLTKMQYKKLGELVPAAKKTAKVQNYKFMYVILCIVENGCKWKALPKNMESGTQFMRNLIDGPKTVQLPKLLLYLFKTLF